MRELLIDVVKTLVLAAALFFVVQSLLQNYEVFGASMEPNLHSEDHLIVSKAAYLSLDLEVVSKVVPFYKADEGSRLHVFGEPKRGDVVIFENPNPPPDRLIKRIVGIPGDVVEIKDGTLYVNSIPIREPYTQGSPSSQPAVVVPDNHYYFLGDNRTRSNDSRNPNIGPVHRSRIIGKAWVSYWPLGDFGIVDSHPIEFTTER